MKLAQRVEKIAPSITLEITSLAKKMKAQGRDVINFAAGEPDFDTPEYIKNTAIDAIEKGFTKYTPSTGTPELKEAICKKLQKDNKLDYFPSQIIVSCGAKHSLYNIFQVLCEEQDEVIFASPYWVSYPEMVNLTGAVNRIVLTFADNGFKLDKELLSSVVNKNTKAIIVNSPANPTGVVYSSAELASIAEVAVKHNLYVISDEIYEKLIFDGNKHVSIAALNKEIFERTIVVNGLSKSHAMTGWRIGYLASSNKEIVAAVSNLQSHSTSNPCSVSQKAAVAALSNSHEDQMREMIGEFQLRRDCMLKGMDEIDELSYIKPEGAFYVFCNISKIRLDSVSFSQRLLEEAEIATIPGAAFGREGYIRMSFATGRDKIEEGIRRLKDWIEKQG